MSQIKNEKLEAFLLQIPDIEDQKSSKLIDYFAYFLTIIEDFSEIMSGDVSKCFEIAHIEKYSNIPFYLSRNSKSKRGKKAKFIKTKGGYRLERSYQLELQRSLYSGPAKLETSHLLRKLLTKLQDKKEQLFLQEVIDCYEIGARRAAIVMVWILTIYHLQEYIFRNELSSFNIVLAKNTDKRIKISKISKIDDFSEIPENKFIEFARSAKIISKDIRKILDTKLGIRNTSAHPSAVKISEVKATDFIIDLVENIIIKYKF